MILQYFRGIRTTKSQLFLINLCISELSINQLNEKLVSAKKDYLAEANRNLNFKNTLKKIKIDLHNMSANLQDPTKLKLSVKVWAS